jgi:hypothetical protein
MSETEPLAPYEQAGAPVAIARNQPEVMNNFGGGLFEALHDERAIGETVLRSDNAAAGPSRFAETRCDPLTG